MGTLQVQQKLPFLHDGDVFRGISPSVIPKRVPLQLSMAADVQISSKGHKLSDDENLTPAERVIKAGQQELEDKRDKKAQAEEIEHRINDDKTLTDDDKKTLQKQADELKRASMTDEDRMNELSNKNRELENLLATGLVTPEDNDVIQERISEYTEEIRKVKQGMNEKFKKDMSLQAQAVQERSDQDVTLLKDQDKAEVPSGQVPDVAHSNNVLSMLNKYKVYGRESAKEPISPHDAGVILSVNSLNTGADS